MMPKKDTIENPSGMPMIWGQTAAEGVVARDAKSGALLKWTPSQSIVSEGRLRLNTNVIRVAMLLMQEPMAATIAHALAEPCRVPGWWMIGPTPWALTMAQTKKIIPAIGTTIALAVKR